MTVSHSAININKIVLGFRKETDEVKSILNPNFPGILCLFEHHLTLILLTWTIWRAPTDASKWRMGFNSAFKGLSQFEMNQISLNKYKLGTNYFTQFISNCTVCIFLHKSIKTLILITEIHTK